MAVVAVGDFDKAAVEALIKTHFASTPVAGRAAAAPDLRHPRPAGHACTRSPTDKEMTDDERRDRHAPAGARAGHRRRLPAEDRRPPVLRHAVGPVLRAGAEAGRAVPRRRSPAAASSSRARRKQASLTALVKEDGIERGLEALLSEAERVTRFGFTATELERQKQATCCASYERMLAEKDNRGPASRADEYIRNFLAAGNAAHRRVTSTRCTSGFLPTITLDEVNRLASEWFPDRNRIVIVDRAGKARARRCPTRRSWRP